MGEKHLLVYNNEVDKERGLVGKAVPVLRLGNMCDRPAEFWRKLLISTVLKRDLFHGQTEFRRGGESLCYRASFGYACESSGLLFIRELRCHVLDDNFDP